MITLTKPFDLGFVLAMIQALLRRSYHNIPINKSRRFLLGEVPFIQ